jgi:hypothetical protein
VMSSIKAEGTLSLGVPVHGERHPPGMWMPWPPFDRLMTDAALRVQFAARAVEHGNGSRWKGSLGCGKSFLRSYGSDNARNRSRSRRSI